MDESVLTAVIGLDEAEALGSIEPFDGSRGHGNTFHERRYADPRAAWGGTPVVEGALVFGMESGAVSIARGAAKSSIRLSTRTVWTPARSFASLVPRQP